MKEEKNNTVLFLRNIDMYSNSNWKFDDVMRYEYTGNTSIWNDFNNPYSSNPNLEIIDIFDIYVLKRIVLIEKRIKYNPYRYKPNYIDNAYYKPHYTDNVYKKIVKKGSNDKYYFTVIHSRDYNKMVPDFQALEKSIDLKKCNAFFDKEDIGQVLEYYLTIDKNVQF